MPVMDERSPGSQIPEAVRTLLVELGEDPGRAGLAGTPDRVRRVYAELT
jgi:GTP cyclohydrolase I